MQKRSREETLWRCIAPSCNWSSRVHIHETCFQSMEEAMLTKIGTITVQVTDQDKALEFYTQKLGFEKRSDEPMGRTSAGLQLLRQGHRPGSFYIRRLLRDLMQPPTRKRKPASASPLAWYWRSMILKRRSRNSSRTAYTLKRNPKSSRGAGGGSSLTRTAIPTVCINN